MEVWNSANVDGFCFYDGDPEGKILTDFQKFADESKEEVDHILFRASKKH